MKRLTDKEIQQFKKHGYLVVKNLAGGATKDLKAWTEEVLSLPLTPGEKQMVYLEESDKPDSDKWISRLEQFVGLHDGYDKLAKNSDLSACVDQLFAEKSVLFKDKINFQPPFGGGIAAHQDIQAGLVLPLDPELGRALLFLLQGFLVDAPGGVVVPGLLQVAGLGEGAHRGDGEFRQGNAELS